MPPINNNLNTNIFDLSEVKEKQELEKQELIDNAELAQLTQEQDILSQLLEEVNEEDDATTSKDVKLAISNLIKNKAREIQIKKGFSKVLKNRAKEIQNEM